jgi:hypothetical protein
LKTATAPGIAVILGIGRKGVRRNRTGTLDGGYAVISSADDGELASRFTVLLLRYVIRAAGRPEEGSEEEKKERFHLFPPFRGTYRLLMPSKEIDPNDMSREELMRELDRAGEDTASLELNGIIAQSQIRFATYDQLRELGKKLNSTG